MNRYSILGVFITLALVTTGCGRLFDGNTQADGDTTMNPEYVVNAEGELMSVACIRAAAGQIAERGASAADNCRMGNVKKQTDAEGRGFYGSYPSWWSYYYIYPPYYYGGSYGNNYGYSNFCNYLGFSSYPSYNCYGDLFGYNTNYYGYYNSNCDSCLNRANPSRCYNRCLYNQGWYWY